MAVRPRVGFRPAAVCGVGRGRATRQNSSVAQGFNSGEIEYDIREDRVTLRRRGGTEFMVFALIEKP